MQVLAWLSFVIGWWRGGRTERFAVAVLFCDYAFTRLTTGMAGAHQMVAVAELVVTLIFVWMAFTSDRWWTLVTSAALALCALVFVLEWANPGLSLSAAISAQSGLWFLVYLSLLAGVAERWLAGEKAAGDAPSRRPKRFAS